MEIYRNLVCKDWNLVPAQLTGCGQTQVVCIRLARCWDIRPEQHLYLTILTRRYASTLQRHPFAIAWWEDDLKGQLLYLVIQPKNGWTRNVIMTCQRQPRKETSIELGNKDSQPENVCLSTRDRTVWLQGPFGRHCRTLRRGQWNLCTTTDHKGYRCFI